jgi:hypothetical protein
MGLRRRIRSGSRPAVVALVAALCLVPGALARGGTAGGAHVAVHLSLVRQGVLSMEGAVRPAGDFRRALVQVRHGRRWTAVHPSVPIRGRGAFSVRWRVRRHTSRVAVRAIALGADGRRVVGPTTSLRIGAAGATAFSVPATTRVYSGDEVSSARSGPSGETVVELASGSARPVAGGHVALGPSPALPFGMFASVARVADAGGGWTVALRQAPIDQVLDDVSVHLDEDVTPQIVDSLGRRAGAGGGPGTIRIAGRASFAHASGLGSVFSCTSAGRSTSADSAFVSTRPMPLSIELTHLHALDDFDTGSLFPHRDPFFLMQVSGEAQATIGFQAKSAFTCKLSDSFRETHRIAVPLGAVGPVPVTMYLEPTLKFEVSGSGTVSLSQHHYWGITLEQNGFSPFKARLAHSADPVDLHTSAAIGASLFAGGDLSVMFGAGEGAWALQAGIYGAFGPDFELTTSTDRPGCLTATAKLEADLGVRLQVLVKRWSAQLASLTSRPVSLGGPWCVGGGGGSGGGGSGGGGSGSGGGGGAPGGGPPGRVTVPGGSFTQVTSGWDFSCGLRAGGAVECWGWHAANETDPPDEPLLAIAAGETFTCGIRLAGTLVCWGFEPPAPPSGTYTQVASDSKHACALTTDGSARCWGDPSGGQTSPPAGRYSQLAVGDSYSCGLRDTGAIVCWGNPVFGLPLAEEVGPFTQISGGAEHLCAVDAAGAISCWGYDGQGQTDDPAGTYKEVSAAGYHTCALRTDGTIACWGEAGMDQNQAPGGSYVEIDSGRFHACARRSDGTVTCWGGSSVEF